MIKSSVGDIKDTDGKLLFNLNIFIQINMKWIMLVDRNFLFFFISQNICLCKTTVLVFA
jgi:hypothetical protein